MDHAVELLAPPGQLVAEPGDLVLVLHVADVDLLAPSSSFPRSAWERTGGTLCVPADSSSLATFRRTSSFCTT